jgi:hypothetical protein
MLYNEVDTIISQLVCAISAMDVITQHLVQHRAKGTTALAYLGSPATAYCIPEEARDDSLARYGRAPFWHGMLGVRQNARDPVAAIDTKGGAYNAFIMDGLIVFQVYSIVVCCTNTCLSVPFPVINVRVFLRLVFCFASKNWCVHLKKGPNYALAKHFQMWRAVQARHAGILVSVNMAPGCRTESVTHAAAAASALEGQALFSPLLAFDSSEVSCVMAMLLLWDLHSPTSTARPSNPLRNHNEIFLQNNFHGGGIRCPYRGETLGTVSYLAGSMGYKFEL